MSRHNPAMAHIWLEVAWGGHTATTCWGVRGVLWLAAIGGARERACNSKIVTSRGNIGTESNDGY